MDLTLGLGKPKRCFICKDLIVGGCVGRIENDHAHYRCVAMFLRKAMTDG